jgi:hypothetical protein
MTWNPDDNDVYYRVLLRNGEYLIATLQWFDEHDYDRSEYATDERFETEELARRWIDTQFLWEPNATDELVFSKLPVFEFTQEEKRLISQAVLGELYRENGAVRDRTPHFPQNRYYIDDLNPHGEVLKQSVSIDAAAPFERVSFSLRVPGVPREGHSLDSDQALSILVVVERTKPIRVHASTYLAKYEA